MKDRSRVIRQTHYRWTEIPVREYKKEGTHFDGITRQTLIGEDSDQSALRFLTRYFEIRPGGYSSLEKHLHPHSVVVIRGSGCVILGDHVETVGRFDCVYIAPGCVHQFHASDDEALGFLCIVDRERDRPQLPTEQELRSLEANPAVASRMKR